MAKIHTDPDGSRWVYKWSLERGVRRYRKSLVFSGEEIFASGYVMAPFIPIFKTPALILRDRVQVQPMTRMIPEEREFGALLGERLEGYLGVREVSLEEAF